MALTRPQLIEVRRSVGDTHRVRVARELLGLTQVELSAALGITQSSLSDLERNRYASTTVDTARKFAEFFGCTIEDLFPAKSEAV